MRLSLSDFLSFFLILPLSTFLSLFQASLLLHRVLTDEQTMSAGQKYQIHELIMADMGEFPYPLDAMPLLVLQVATVDVPGGHVKDLASLLLPFCPLRGFSLSLCFMFCPSFLYMLTQESSLRCSSPVDNMYDMKCHPPPSHSSSISPSHINWKKTQHVAN